MKMLPLATLLAASIQFIATAGAQTATDIKIPTGKLTTGSAIVKAGEKTSLNWEITYPPVITDYVKINDPGTIVPSEKLKMDVRVLGAGVTTSNLYGLLNFVTTKSYISYNEESWVQIFSGTNLSVNPLSTSYSRVVEAGKTVRFGSWYYYNGAWTNFYYSNMGNSNVRALVNGQVPPTAYPLHTAPTLEDFIRPYLDAGGKVKIGPMDVIILMELTHTPSQSTQLGFDLQDMVLLVTFSKP